LITLQIACLCSFVSLDRVNCGVFRERIFITLYDVMSSLVLSSYTTNSKQELKCYIIDLFTDFT